MLLLNNQQVHFIDFPNKERRLDLPKDLVKDMNTVIWHYENDGSIFELLLFEKVMFQLKKPYDLIVGYMPYSRMDRIQEDTTAFSLELLCKLLANNTIMLNKVFVSDPHSPVTLELLHKNNIPAEELNYSLADTVMEYANVDLENAWIVFPDKGAALRYDESKYPNVIICEKTRDFATGRITNMTAHIHKQTTTPDSNAPLIIIDDLCSYGGTFIRAIDAVKELTDVTSTDAWLIVTHAEQAIDEGSVMTTFNKVFCTDSIATPNGAVNMSESSFDNTKQVYVKSVQDIVNEIF